MPQTKRQFISALEWIRKQDERENTRMSERWLAYNRLPAIPLEIGGKITTETRRQGDLLFAEVCKSPLIKGYKLDDKLRFCQDILYASKRAMHKGGCVRYDRDITKTSRLQLQVIDAAVEQGFFKEHRSKPGSPKMSRLVPTEKMRPYYSQNPWAFDPDNRKTFVILSDRGSDQELPIDWSIKLFADTQERLKLINKTNRHCEITYEPINPISDRYGTRRGLACVAYARFLMPDTERHGDGFLHGRIYVGRHGHQSLNRQERKTIEFNGRPSVELDYSGLHPRLLYHLAGIEYDADPYHLWDDKTTDSARMLVKVLMNALINADNDTDALRAANRSLSTKEINGQRKQGKSLHAAQKLYEAYRKTDIPFKSMIPLIRHKHERIAHAFGSDAGVKLMRIDSAIALDVLTHFAKRCVPCLSCHDSFIVPKTHEVQLKRAMVRYYRKRTKFDPIVKR